MMTRMEIEYGEGGSADVQFTSGLLSVRGRCGVTEDEFDDLVFLSQVHSADILVSPSGGEVADGLIMDAGSRAPALRVADCLPVFLASEERTAAFHAGWRGLAAGIASRMIELFSGTPDMVVLGPSICAECYEVGPEVRNAVLDGISTDGHPPDHLDLGLAAVERMRKAGLPSGCPVFRLPGCTKCTPGMFHSHRGDGTLERNILWMRGAQQRQVARRRG